MDKIIREHDAVVLLRDLADSPFVAGDTGVVVYIYDNSPSYEIEFANPEGKPRYLVVTVDAKDVLKLHPRGHVTRTVA